MKVLLNRITIKTEKTFNETSLAVMSFMYGTLSKFSLINNCSAWEIWWNNMADERDIKVNFYIKTRNGLTLSGWANEDFD